MKPVQLEINGVLYFDSDDDFETFALDPMTVCVGPGPDGDEVMRMRHNFSSLYNDAVHSGKKFCIRDLNSRVNKNGLLGTRWASYRIPRENIETYWGED